MSTVFAARYLGHRKAEGSIIQQATQCLRKMQHDLESERTETRKVLAQRLWRLRKYLQRRMKKKAQSDAQREHAEKLLSATAAYHKATLKAEKDCLELSLRIAQEVTGEHMQQYRESIAKRVQTELLRLRQQEEVTLFAHPDSKPTLKSLLQSSTLPMQFRIEVASHLNPEVIEIRTSAGSVVIDWNVHFERIANHLRSLINQSRDVEEAA